MTTNPRRTAAGRARSRSESSAADQAQASEGLWQDNRIADLQDKVDQLSATVIGLAGLTAIENVMVEGFETLAAQMAPLAHLIPERESLTADQIARLAVLRASLQRFDWKNRSGALPINEDPVRFIFASVPDALLPPDSPFPNRGPSRQ